MIFLRSADVHAMTSVFMGKLSNEAKVGALVLGTFVVAVAFAWALGLANPFRQSRTLYVTYNFAGGIEIGSPVRVSGIKVGKVEDIEFFVPSEDQDISSPQVGEAQKELALTPVKLKISVLEKATAGLREDSQFFINLAGIIGERYIEITPGSMAAKRLEPGVVVAGVDPPRIDQLISQSFDLAGRVTQLVEDNKEDITKSIETLYKLSKNFNDTLRWVDKSALFKTNIKDLVNNLIAITRHVKVVTEKVETEEGKKTLKLLHELLWRLEPLEAELIRNFLQKEGIRVQFF